jgi:hypothetical protein
MAKEPSRIENLASGIHRPRSNSTFRVPSPGPRRPDPEKQAPSPRSRIPKNTFTPQERKLIRALRTPRQVQAYLRSLPYNWEKEGETLRTFRGVVREGEAHCLEAALTAAAILEQHGYPPLLLDLESQDRLDHVLFLFHKEGLWGTVARSRDAGLHGRKPVFRTLRDLVLSYVDPYVDGCGRIIGYGVLNLSELKRCDWRLSPRNVWTVERTLITMPHTKLVTSDKRYRTVLQQFRAFRERYPTAPVTFYTNRSSWM